MLYKEKLTKIEKNVIGGYTITCVGDERTFSYLPSRNGNTISDKIALKVLNKNKKRFKIYSWLDRKRREAILLS